MVKAFPLLFCLAAAGELLQGKSDEDDTMLQANRVHMLVNASAGDERCLATMGHESAPSHMVSVMPSICDGEVTELTNADFLDGTYIIETPGIYRLVEDIVMEPAGDGVDEKLHPKGDSVKYAPEKGYWLGFFAAIAVSTNDVFIDLNGHKIEQSPKFLRAQRFFQTIQLGSKPFPAGVGPPQFSKMTEPLISANNVVVADGILGSTSHIGIHGTGVSNIWLHNTHIKDYEVGGMQINGCRHCYVTDTVVGPSSKQVPGLATLSQALLLLRVVGLSKPEWLTEHDEFAELDTRVDEYIAGTCGDSCDVFRPPIEEGGSTLPDGGAIYGLLFHRANPAIGDFIGCAKAADETAGYGPIEISNTKINDLQLRAEEIIQMHVGGNTDNKAKSVKGPAGDQFQIEKLAHGGEYSGNIVSNAQVKLGRLKRMQLSSGPALSKDEMFGIFGSTNMPNEVIEWADGLITYDSMLSGIDAAFKCQMDSMNHFNKGVMGIRLGTCDNVVLRNIEISGLRNVGVRSASCEGAYKGNDVRGITATKADISSENVVVSSLESINGQTIGFEQRMGVELSGTVDLGEYETMKNDDCDTDTHH